MTFYTDVGFSTGGGGGGGGEGGIQSIKSGDKVFKPNPNDQVTLGSSAQYNVQGFSTDLASDAILQNGAWGLGSLSDTPMTMATGFMSYKSASAEVPGAGAGYTICAGINHRVQHFTTTGGKIYERVSTSTTILDAATPWVTPGAGVAQITANGQVFKLDSNNNITLKKGAAYDVINGDDDNTASRLVTNDGWMGVGLYKAAETGAGFSFKNSTQCQGQYMAYKKSNVTPDIIPANDSIYYYFLCISTNTSSTTGLLHSTFLVTLSNGPEAYVVSRTTSPSGGGDLTITCDKIGGTQVYPAQV